MRERKHNFIDDHYNVSYWATERKTCDSVEFLYGKKHQDPHNHIGIMKNGSQLFHEIMRPGITISWTDSSITNVGRFPGL